jgi:prevent-host-death family protein
MSCTVSKSGFMGNSSQYLRIVEETGTELIVTDHGRPVIRITAYLALPSRISLGGSALRYERPVDPVGDVFRDAVE